VTKRTSSVTPVTICSTPAMECYQARLDSFSKPKRVKNPSLTTSSSIKWPHTSSSSFTATPNTLAEAGFYFDPTWDDRDNVVCFMCNKELSDWAEDDDPFGIHWEKCRATCVWAQVRCGLMEDIDDDGRRVFHCILFTFLSDVQIRTSI